MASRLATMATSPRQLFVPSQVTCTTHLSKSALRPSLSSSSKSSSKRAVFNLPNGTHEDNTCISSYKEQGSRRANGQMRDRQSGTPQNDEVSTPRSGSRASRWRYIHEPGLAARCVPLWTGQSTTDSVMPAKLSTPYQTPSSTILT